jgi:hypothetical protein
VCNFRSSRFMGKKNLYLLILFRSCWSMPLMRQDDTSDIRTSFTTITNGFNSSPHLWRPLIHAASLSLELFSPLVGNEIKSQLSSQNAEMRKAFNTNAMNKIIQPEYLQAPWTSGKYNYDYKPPSPCHFLSESSRFDFNLNLAFLNVGKRF